MGSHDGHYVPSEMQGNQVSAAATTTVAGNEEDHHSNREKTPSNTSASSSRKGRYVTTFMIDSNTTPAEVPLTSKEYSEWSKDYSGLSAAEWKKRKY